MENGYDDDDDNSDLILCFDSIYSRSRKNDEPLIRGVFALLKRQLL